MINSYYSNYNTYFSSFPSFVFLSASDATLQRHITATPINAPKNKPIIKPNISISPFYNFILLRRQRLCIAQPLPAIYQSFWIVLNFTLSDCRYLSSISCDKEHIRQLCIQLHWNLTTLRISQSRPRMLRRFYHARLSTGRKYHYPLCLSSLSLYLPYKVRVLKSFIGVRSCSLSIPNSRRKVSDVLIFCFQGSQRYKITPSLYLPLSERVDNHKN